MDTYEQIELGSIYVSQHDLITAAFNKINSLISDTYGDTGNITLKENKTYYTICFFNVPKLRLRRVYNDTYLEIPEHFKEEMLRNNVENKFMSDRYYRIKFSSENLDKDLKSLILDIYDYCFRKYSDDRFDCCSKYLECSDNKKCPYVGEAFSRACSYHYTMINKKKIYYGKNRNV